MNKKGFLYIMTTDGSPGLVKVGMTTKVPTERAKELGTTGVPKPYVVQYYALFDDMIQAEKKAQNALYKYHYGKEFYKIDVATAIYHIENVGIPFTRLHSKPEDDRVADKLRLKMQREQEEKERAEIKLHERKSREEERKEAYLKRQKLTKKVKKWFLNKYGQGTHTWPNGNKYVGEWEDGKMHGQGAMVYGHGYKYVGEWKSGERYGLGTYTWADGRKYEGEWKDDMIHGQGTLTWSNGNKYEGERKSGERYGLGTYTWADGRKYEGEWKDDMMHGQGTQTWPGGEKYVGEYKDGVRHGQGTYTYSSGNKYSGEWKDGKKHGQGTYIYSSGKKYVGEWKDGKMHGQGAMPYASGNKQQLPEKELSKSHGLNLKNLNIHDKIDPLVVTVSREEINLGDIEPALSILKQLISSPDIATTYKEKIDIAFHGYDTDFRELFELPEVRDYVHKLDEKFPFWLYFLSKKHLGLQALLFCFLPPYLTEEAKAEIYPQKIDELLTKCWFPAMNRIGDYVGMSEKENEVMTERAIQYITYGRFT